ncbi:MAG: DUF4625 domain-containing protein [Weeksellaceae bacterium]|nr:DUF4625 domain-containing protein [Weeksellaceae bacterium]
MNSFFKTLILAATPILLLSSCSSDDDKLDTEKPKIVLGKPTDHQSYELGSTIEVQAILSDNVELGSYKIDIHSDGDGHEHRSTTTNWDFSDTGVIEGNKEYVLNKTIQIPAGNITEGHYHLGIMVIDKAGNETESYIEIVVGEDHHH